MSALDRNNAEHPPNIRVQSEEDKAKSESLAKQVTNTEKALTDHRKSSEPSFKTWLKEQQAGTTSSKTLPDLVLELPLNKSQDKGITDSS